MVLPEDPQQGAPGSAVFSNLTAAVGPPIECRGCHELIVIMQSGTYRLDARDFTKDRVQCVLAGGHQPVAEMATGLPAATRRTPVPWSGNGETPSRTGEAP